MPFPVRYRADEIIFNNHAYQHTIHFNVHHKKQRYEEHPSLHGIAHNHANFA